MDKITEIINTLINLLGEMSPYILLGFIIAGFLHAFIPTSAFSKHLSGNGWKTIIKSALIGVPLPLCSCGVLPTAISLKRSGASNAATTSFLVATPQTGIDSITATWSLLGPAFAVIRPISAFFTACVSGVAVGKSTKVDNKESNTSEKMISAQKEHKSVYHKVSTAFKYGFVDLIDSIGSWLLIGLIIAALITVFIPTDFFVILREYPLLAMIAVVVIAIPMYICATGSIPIALSLMLKGLSPGTALVLLMAGPAANFASFTLISRELGKKSAIIYVTSIVVCSILFGIIVDFLLPIKWFIPSFSSEMHCHTTNLNMFEIISSIILSVLLVSSFIRKFIIIKIKNRKMEEKNDVSKAYRVTGMNCAHCQSSVVKALKKVIGVTDVSVNLSSGIAMVYGEHNSDEAIENVTQEGFGIIKL